MTTLEAQTAARDDEVPPAWTHLSATGARRLGLAVAVASIVALALGFGLAGRELLTAWVMPGVAALTTGALVVARRPGHPVGWLFLWFGAASSLSFLAYAPVYAAVGAGTPLPASLETVPEWVAWLESATTAFNTATVAVLVPLSLLLFPDGRLPSRRWRWVTVTALMAAALGGVAAFLAGGWGGDPLQQIVENPLPEAASSVGSALSQAFFPLLLLTWVAAAASFLVRFRRTEGVQRQQLKWLAVAAAYSIVVVAGVVVTVGGNVAGGVEAVVVSSALTAPPVAAGIAILQYRLWDIDVVIRRSVVVGGLVAFVTGLYIALVVGVGQLLGTDDADPVLSVLATAIVAVAFQPVREQLDRLANRLVYGRRATPYEVLAGFSQRVAGTETPGDALGRVARLLVEGTGASRATVWLRVGDRLRLAAATPDAAGDPVELPLAAGETLPDLGADLVAPVVEGGELLGALTLSKSRSEPPTPADASLLQRLAGQAGLLLRNQRLTAELEDRVEELAVSRRRLLHAADTARHQLEQRLAAATADRLDVLDAGVTATAAAARQAGAERTTALLDRVAGAVDGARAAFADLASGLYPSELTDHGLATALRRVAEQATTPVTCDLADVGRLSPDHAVALWFTALEALQNAAKHAGGAPARLSLLCHDEEVELVITDLGPGFDPSIEASGAGLANMRDRLAALGGTLELVSAPGSGTSVTARVPVSAAAPAMQR